MGKGSRLAFALDRLDWDGLPPSIAVDLLQFVAGTKAAVRLDLARMTDRGTESILHCLEKEHLPVADDGAYLCFTDGSVTPRTVLAVDASPEPHARLLGRLLGYPDCCSEVVARAGEAVIDELAEERARWVLHGDFRLIASSKYADGLALISHLPCHQTCGPSLQLAIDAIEFLRRRVGDQVHRPWTFWQKAMLSLRR